MLALLSRRDGRAGAADRQDAIVSGGFVETAGDDNRRDRPSLIGLQAVRVAVAEDQERLTPLHPLDLSRQRFEVGGRANDGIAQAGLDQRALEGELGMLEGEARLLHADRRQAAPCARRPRLSRRQERPYVCGVVDRPGILRRGRCARRGTRRARRSARPAKPSRASEVASVTSPYRTAAPSSSLPMSSAASVPPTPARGRTRHTTSWPRATSARTGRAADGAGGAEHEHAARHEWISSPIVTMRGRSSPRSASTTSLGRRRRTTHLRYRAAPKPRDDRLAVVDEGSRGRGARKRVSSSRPGAKPARWSIALGKQLGVVEALRQIGDPLLEAVEQGMRHVEVERAALRRGRTHGCWRAPGAW